MPRPLNTRRTDDPPIYGCMGLVGAGLSLLTIILVVVWTVWLLVFHDCPI